jgi:hypothetical protein
VVASGDQQVPKITPVQKVQVLCGVALPNIRREVAARLEKIKQELDLIHPIWR